MGVGLGVHSGKSNIKETGDIYSSSLFISIQGLFLDKILKIIHCGVGRGEWWELKSVTRHEFHR